MSRFGSAPSWHVPPMLQLKRARKLWPGATLPEPPAHFVPRTRTEVLLLHVPDKLLRLWEMVPSPKYCDAKLENLGHKCQLRPAPNKIVHTRPVWLGFDFEYGKGARPVDLWGQPDLAGPEVLSAAIQFPELWSDLELIGGSVYRSLNLSGYQLNCGEGWTLVPCMSHYVGPVGSLSDIMLYPNRSDFADEYGMYSSPTARVVG